MDLKTLIAKGPVQGIPVLKIRDLFNNGPEHVTTAHAGHYFKCSEVTARKVLVELETLGYLKKVEDDCWYVQPEGLRLGAAKAIPRMIREKAADHLARFLERVLVVNELADDFNYRVIRVTGFGSFFFGRDPTVGDIDLVIESHSHNRTPGIYFDYFAAYARMLRFLKSRDRILSFHSTGDLTIPGLQTTVLFEAEKTHENGG